MKIQKFVFSENGLVVHQGGQLDMGRLALFAKKTIPWTTKEGVFLKVWRPRCSSKKRHPGIRGLRPRIAFCTKMSAKPYGHGKCDWILLQNENQREFPEYCGFIKIPNTIPNIRL